MRGYTFSDRQQKDARARRVGVALSLLAAAIAISGALSWLFEKPVLRNFGVGASGMSPLSIPALLVAAAGALAAHVGASRFSRLCGAVAGVIGCEVLTEWVLGTRSSVGEFLVRDQPNAWAIARVSVPGGVTFMLLGAALLLLGRGRTPLRRPSDYLGIVAALGSFAVLTAYAYGATTFAPMLGAKETGMSLPTGIALLMLAVSILLVDARRGLIGMLLADTPGGFLARRVVLLAALGPPLLGILMTAGRGVVIGDPLVRVAVLTVLASATAIFAVMVAAHRLNASDMQRRSAEDLLRVNEERFRLMFEHATDGIFFATRDGVYTDVNEAGCRMLRSTREQIIGRTILEFVRPEEVSRLLEERDAVYAGHTVTSEWTMRRGDGTFCVIEVATRVLPDGRWLALTRDVSERKAAEEQIRSAHEAELRLRRQIEAVSDATTAVADAVAQITESDLRAVLRTVIIQAMAVTGARHGAVGIGGEDSAPFDPWVANGITEEAAREIEASAPTGSSLAVQIRYRGKRIGLLFLAEKVDGTDFSADDQRAVSILADRVAIALETARLYETEARERSWLQITIDQMPEPVLLANASGEVSSWNRAAAALLHATPAPEGGLPLDLRWPNGAPVQSHEHPLHRACTLGEPISGVELVAVARDGRRIPVLASAAPLPRDEHGLHGAVAILQDITHQKELERLREEWTAIVAHDLRQPIASIALAAQLLQRGSLGGDDAKLVGRIGSGADRVRRMVDDLLDYAQIEAGHLRIAPRPLDLKPLVAEVLDRLGPNALGHPVRLVLKDVDARVEVDPVRIDQVITNLVSNAAKYSFAGSEILVTVGGSADEIEIAVENRGPGMTSAELGRLFARFARMQAAEAMGVKGIGLGLFITKGIVEAHGGRIWAESTPFETTTFHVVLPAQHHRRAA